MARRQAPMSHPITITRDGKQYYGTYCVDRGVVTVTTLYAMKSTQVGGSPAESIAKVLFGELITEGKADG